MLGKALLAGLAAVAVAAVVTPAKADNISENQWYTGHFTDANTPLLGGAFGGGLGVNGPLLGGGVGDAVDAPDVGGNLNAIITLSAIQYLTVTDVEISGDQFQIFVNGVAATPAPVGANGLTPSGQQSLVGGFTSVPSLGDSSAGEDISAALADANYSSGTFVLSPGVNTITGTYLGTVLNGDFDFIVTSPSAVPEPSTLALLGAGLAGLGLFRRRRKQDAAA